MPGHQLNLNIYQYKNATKAKISNNHNEGDYIQKQLVKFPNWKFSEMIFSLQLNL